MLGEAEDEAVAALAPLVAVVVPTHDGVQVREERAVGQRGPEGRVVPAAVGRVDRRLRRARTQGVRCGPSAAVGGGRSV